MNAFCWEFCWEFCGNSQDVGQPGGPTFFPLPEGEGKKAAGALGKAAWEGAGNGIGNRSGNSLGNGNSVGNSSGQVSRGTA